MKSKLIFTFPTVLASVIAVSGGQSPAGDRAPDRPPCLVRAPQLEEAQRLAREWTANQESGSR